MKKLMYLTVTAPLGKPEAFLISEMKCLVDRGVDLTVIPIHPSRRLYHQDGAGLLSRTMIPGL